MRLGVRLSLLGLAIVGAAVLWALAGPAADANIGAGLLVLVGAATALAGLVVIGLAVLDAQRQRRRAPGTR